MDGQGLEFASLWSYSLLEGLFLFRRGLCLSILDIVLGASLGHIGFRLLRGIREGTSRIFGGSEIEISVGDLLLRLEEVLVGVLGRESSEGFGAGFGGDTESRDIGVSSDLGGSFSFVVELFGVVYEVDDGLSSFLDCLASVDAVIIFFIGLELRNAIFLILELLEASLGGVTEQVFDKIQSLGIRKNSGKGYLEKASPFEIISTQLGVDVFHDLG